MQREIDEKQSNEDREDGFTLQWAGRCSKSNYHEKKYFISALNHRVKNDDLFDHLK